MLLPVVLLIAAAFCVACGKNGGTENATPTDKLRTEWHQLVKPVTNEDYTGIIAKSREIRERLFPKKEISPLGSGRSKAEANGEPYVFGDSNAKSLTEIDLHTDLPLTGWNDADALLPILLYLKEGFHHFVHRDVTLQVVRLVEVAFGIALGAAQVDKVDAVPEAAHHGGKVVVGSHSKRAGAEAKPIGWAWHGIDECLEVLCCAEDSGQAQYRHGRVVGVNDEPHACFLRSRAHFF